jgi:ABC-type nitrate/sulfonate/bicarbonate transport system permease component
MIRLGPVGIGRLTFAALFLLVWEAAGHTLFDPEFLSPPSAIVGAMPSLLSDPLILTALGQTLLQLAAAFVVAVVLGVAIGLLVGLHPVASEASLPAILLAYSIPQVTILPLFVLYFGVGAASKIAFGVCHGVFPILLSVIVGVKSCDPAFIKVAQSMGATRRQIVRRIIVPSMIPGLFSSFRVAMSACLLGVLLAELYASTGGVGYYARLFSESFNPPATFALVTVLTLMAVLLNEVARRLEIRASKWRVTDAEEAV